LLTDCRQVCNCGANRLAGLTVNGVTQGYGYAANGNLTSRGAQAFSFDIGNRLTSAPGKASYAYDGHGRRTWVAYADGSWKLQVYGSSGKLLYTNHSSQGNTRHVYLGSRLIAEVNSLTGTSYGHTDALGSPVARTNSAGQVLGRTRYESYGATAAGTNPTGIGFTGHVNDADTGLVYMQQRYYEPIAGRFLSVDPVTTDANGGSFNRYLYANGNPYLYVDPDGRQSLSDFRYFGSGSVLPGAPETCEIGRNCEQDLQRLRARGVPSGAVGYLSNSLTREQELMNERIMSRKVCPASHAHICSGTSKAPTEAEAAAQRKALRTGSGALADRLSTGSAMAAPFVGPEALVAAAFLKSYSYWAVPPSRAELAYDVGTTLVAPFATRGLAPIGDTSLTFTLEVARPFVTQPRSCPPIPQRC
jgi:RHS repeat-associated protein